MAGSIPKTVRVTVELQPAEHRDLRHTCDQLAEQIGVARVAGAEIFRALLARMRADSDLHARISADLRQSGGSRR